MFEDFENRMGFWKDLGSNFTINYSGSNPSFLSSGEMWQSMDGATTQTLAAWENGWDLTNNPDGTMTANPKYTSGLPSETIVRVPVGPQSPMSSPTSGVGGVVVTGYGAENKTFAATATIPSLKEIYENGHAYIESFTIGSSATGVSFPEDDIIQITGHDGTYKTRTDYDPSTEIKTDHYGTVMRIRAIPGYQVFVGGFVGNGYGGTIHSRDLPYRKTIYIIGPDGTKYMPTSGTGGSEDTDTNDCASENRAVNTDDTCGDCITGYTEDTAGTCIADEPAEEEEETNWLLWGGIAAVAAFALIG
jgi:hypothetical protein